MPNIGRPQQQNPYKKIQMADKSQKQRSQQAQQGRGGGGAQGQGKLEVGRKLNRMAGVKPDKQFKSFEEHTQLDKDGFLKLLSHQLQNQDPMKPMDQKKFAADLAQFSQLEQMTNMNNNIESMTKEAGGKDKFYGASFLGKEVFTKGSTLNHEEGTSTDVPFHLEKPAKKVLVRIYDDQNQLVANVEKEGMASGQNNVKWNGIALDDTSAAPGKYQAKVWAWDNQMNKFQGETQASGQVTGVNFKEGETVLIVDGEKEVFLRDVQRFNLPDGDKPSKGQVGGAPSQLRNQAPTQSQNQGAPSQSQPQGRPSQSQLQGRPSQSQPQARPSQSQNQGSNAGASSAQQLQNMSNEMKQQLRDRAAAKMPGLQKQAQSAYDNGEAR